MSLMLLSWGLLLMALVPWLRNTPAPAPPAPPSMRAADFLDTVGVNTHIGSDPYNDPAQLWSMLAFLGTAHVRQSSPTGAADLAAMGALGALGARIDLIVNGGGPVDLDGALGTVRALAPYLDAVEGVNEAVIFPITYRGITGVDAAAALQKDLYAAVRADPALAGAAVYMFTLGGVDPGAYPSLGDLSADTDFANVHSYPPHGLRPIFVIHAAIDGGRTDAPSRPVVLTETGYYTLPGTTGWGGVPDAVQASYLLDLLLDEAAAGVHRTYLYDLIDDGADPGGTNQEDHFGLFRFDGTPKPAAIAIHTLSVLLADAGPASRTFQADGLPFTAAGVPYNYTGNTLALDKSDGTHVIAVWNEEQLWNTDTQTAIPAQHVPVTVTLASAVATVLVYDPLVGTDPVQTLHNVSSVALDITDHPIARRGAAGPSALNGAPPLSAPPPDLHRSKLHGPKRHRPKLHGPSRTRDGVGVLHGPHGCQGPVRDAQLAEQGLDVDFDGLLRDAQLACDGLVRHPVDQAGQGPAFAVRQRDVPARPRGRGVLGGTGRPGL